MQLGKKESPHQPDFTFRKANLWRRALQSQLRGREWNLTTGYRYTYNDFNIYEKGERTYGISFNHHFGEVGFTKSWKKRTSQVGRNLPTLQLRLPPLSLRGQLTDRYYQKESYLKFGTQYAVNTLDDIYFPTKGAEFDMEYYYAIPLNGNKAFHTAGIHWNAAFSFNSRFTLMPRIEGRYLTTETPWPR